MPPSQKPRIACRPSSGKLGRQPVVPLARHDKPVAVLLADHEYRRLLQKTSFARDLDALRRRLKESGVAITVEDLDSLRDRSEGRELSTPLRRPGEIRGVLGSPG